MNRKYEFTGETQNFFGRILHRIRAVVDIDPLFVRAGDLGGWVETARNLAYSGDAWVFDEAKVFDDARVYGNAQVYDNARVFGDTQVFERARVDSNAAVFGCASVSGHAAICGEAKVYGIAQVCGAARVFGGARVLGNAQVCGTTEIFGDAILCDGRLTKTQHYLCVGPVGPLDAYVTLNLTSGTICAVDFEGSLEEFAVAVRQKHKDNEHAKAYARLIAYFKAELEAYNASS